MNDSRPTIGVPTLFVHRLRSDIEQMTGYQPVFLGLVGRTEASAYGGWGFRWTTRRLRRLAAAKGRPYFAFEEGFISYPTPVPAGPPLSMIMDRGGVYYDSASGSELFAMLDDPRWATPEMEGRATAGIAFLRENKLSKYNGRDLAPSRSLPRGRALVVDQTFRDLSISGAAAGDGDFATMLDAAIAAHGADNVVAKLHPLTVAGRRKGHLNDLARARGVRVIDWPLNPWDAIEPYDDVYVVSSQLGFEAICLGKRVHCFGLPFYAGLGLTQDHLKPRVPRQVKLGTLFAAFFFGYTRFFSPHTRRIVPFEEGVSAIADLARRHGEFAAPAICYGISSWKRPTIERFFIGARTKPVFETPDAAAPPPAVSQGRRGYVWASKIDMTRLPDRPDERPVLVEDGFIRSVGLGAAKTAPLSVVFDAIGMYFDGTRESGLEQILSGADFPPKVVARAQALRKRIVAAGITKYNVGRPHGIDRASINRRIVLVPGQVEDDLSIRFGCEDINTNRALLEATRKAAQDAFIIYKPHPDVENGYRPGGISPRIAASFADLVVGQASMADLLEVIDEVHTMTSLTGFEALLRGRRVTTYGRPFYAGWGLTEDRLPFPRRSRRLTLDELVAGALILYPRYLHPRSGYLCEPEDILDHLAAPATMQPEGLADRLQRWTYGIVSLRAN